jgi:hypothetical protein
MLRVGQLETTEQEAGLTWASFNIGQRALSAIPDILRQLYVAILESTQTNRNGTFEAELVPRNGPYRTRIGYLQLGSEAIHLTREWYVYH